MEFRLILKDALDANFNTTTICLENQNWCLSEPLRFGVSNIPHFAAISYRWGLGRLPNPFHDGHQMSDQTYYALSAAIKNSTCTAFWIDALCIPVDQPARSATLGAMGFIYSIAEEVVVSFPAERSAILKELQNSDRLTDEALLDLENDEWVKSIWTYDEVVNSQKLMFVSENHTIGGLEFMDAVGYSLSFYEKAHGLSSFDTHQKLPHLDALVDLIGDWQTAAFTERSAFQVISNLDQRFCTGPENYFYAMIASITAEIIPIEQAPAISVESLAETMMKICEKKNDYSFIFSTAERDRRQGKEWMPVPGITHSILPWHSVGNSQTGRWDKDGFRLSDMILLKPLPVLGTLGTDFINAWLKRGLSTARGASVSPTVCSNLLQMGFPGVDKGIPTSHGLFYPQTHSEEDEVSEIFVSTQIHWTFGAPALAKTRCLEKIKYIPGVFIGDLDKGLASDVLL